MTRYFVMAVIGIALVVAIGLVVRGRWFGSPDDPPVKAPTATPRPEPSRTTATGSGAVPERVAVVVDLTGKVERRAGSVWVELKAGDQLTPQDTIRTAPDAHANLDVGAAVMVDGATEITVGEITSSVSQLSLTEGRVRAQARGAGAPRIRIATRGTDAVAETGDGTFNVLTSGKGDVAVATEAGTVSLTAAARTVEVGAGQYSTVRAGGEPTLPTTIPGSLFLKVKAEGANREVAGLSGETLPGAVVSINGVRAPTDDRGRFTDEVPLKKGDNVIVVSVMDALGRSEQRVIRKTVPVKARPRLQTEVQWE